MDQDNFISCNHFMKQNWVNSTHHFINSRCVSWICQNKTKNLKCAINKLISQATCGMRGTMFIPQSDNMNTCSNPYCLSKAVPSANLHRMWAFTFTGRTIKDNWVLRQQIKVFIKYKARTSYCNLFIWRCSQIWEWIS